MRTPFGHPFRFIPAVLTLTALVLAVPAAHSSGGAQLSLAVKSQLLDEVDLTRIVLTPEEQSLVDLCNAERRKRKLAPLVVDSLLIWVARQHSAEMRDQGYFNHRSPSPGLSTPMDRFLSVLGRRPSYAAVGENLFYCSVMDVYRGHRAFMNSPTHRANVLDGEYERIGVGVARNSKGEFWVTQMFLSTEEGRRDRTTAED